MTQSQEIHRLVGELLEAWNAHDVERVVALYAPDYEGTDVGEATVQQGLSGLRKTVRRYLRAFPDLRIAGEEPVVEGNRVALVWTTRGTHQGPFMRIPPTGRAVTLHGMSLLTVEEGKITRGLRIWDVAGFLRTIGLLPELSTVDS